ncbi:MAG: hypothetical protein ACI86M_001763, partial [Saprospiraceae bacterium]
SVIKQRRRIKKKGDLPATGRSPKQSKYYSYFNYCMNTTYLLTESL